MKETSKLAYLSSEKVRETDSKLILKVLFENSTKKQGAEDYNSDLTYLEIAEKLKWSNANKVSRRTSELVRTKKIKETGQKICPIGKKLCTTYEIIINE